jgi:PPOX class probable F420-dependent enzyme
MNNLAQTSPALEAFKRQQFINLTTWRKNGAAVITTVWFALENGKLYGTSQAQAGKLKRIRNHPQVTFAPATYNSKVLGETCQGMARLLAPEEYPLARTALKRKYGLQFLLLSGVARLSGRQDVFWEITPQ